MVSNINYSNKLVKLLKDHKKLAITGVSLIGVAGLVLGLTSGDITKGKVENYQQPPAVVEHLNTNSNSQNSSTERYNGFDIAVDEGTKITIEPRHDSSYVGTVRVSQNAKLLMIDGEYALISYNIPQEKYNYDLSHDHTRLGFVPLETVHSLSSYTNLFENVGRDNRYVQFDHSTRIRNEMGDGGILTTANEGDYARVVGQVLTPEWSNDEWYVVAYNGSNGTFLGYMEGRNGKFISQDEMAEIIDTEREYLRVTGNDVNMRSEPEKDRKNVQTKLNNGDEALLLGRQDGWYHVSYGGYSGYISSELDCLEVIRDKKLPNGIETLHFEAPEQKSM